MKRWKLFSGVAVAVVLVAGATVALAGPRFEGARDLGFRAYWSVLDAAQKDRAKSIAADYLAETAPDRLSVASRVLRFRADVAAVLTVEQRKAAGRRLVAAKDLSREERGARLERLLATMDRGAVADQVARMETSSPEERVDLALQLFDEFRAAAEQHIVAELKLTEAQVAAIHGLADAAKADVRPVAIRVATAKDAAKEQGLALLRPDQRTRLDALRADGRERILALLRGTR